MPFIIQGKANLRYILAVVIIATLAGGGILWYWQAASKEAARLGEFPEVRRVDKIADETVDWKTYRNEEYGFEMKYPDFFLSAPLTHCVTRTYYRTLLCLETKIERGGTDGLMVAVLEDRFERYIASHTPPSCAAFRFDRNTGRWLRGCRMVFSSDPEDILWEEDMSPSEREDAPIDGDPPGRINSSLEAYLFRSGHGFTSWDDLIIPSASDAFVVAIRHIIRSVPEEGFEDFDVTSILSTFRFLE